MVREKEKECRRLVFGSEGRVLPNISFNDFIDLSNQFLEKRKPFHSPLI